MSLSQSPIHIEMSACFKERVFNIIPPKLLLFGKANSLNSNLTSATEKLES